MVGPENSVRATVGGMVVTVAKARGILLAPNPRRARNLSTVRESVHCIDRLVTRPETGHLFKDKHLYSC